MALELSEAAQSLKVIFTTDGRVSLLCDGLQQPYINTDCAADEAAAIVYGGRRTPRGPWYNISSRVPDSTQVILTLTAAELIGLTRCHTYDQCTGVGAHYSSNFIQKFCACAETYRKPENATGPDTIGDSKSLFDRIHETYYKIIGGAATVEKNRFAHAHEGDWEISLACVRVSLLFESKAEAESLKELLEEIPLLLAIAAQAEDVLDCCKPGFIAVSRLRESLHLLMKNGE